MRAAKSRHEDDPVLITEAEPSLDEQFRARRKKYAIMMSTRTLCLIAAAISYKTWWLMVFFVIGAAVLPWMAVLIANDRPPKKAKNVNRYGGHPDPARAIEAPPGQGRIIEG